MTEYLLSPLLAAREHLAWCATLGMTPNEVCESVNAFLTEPTWRDVERLLVLRWNQLNEGRPMSFISDRSVA